MEINAKGDDCDQPEDRAQKRPGRDPVPCRLFPIWRPEVGDGEDQCQADKCNAPLSRLD